MKRSSGKPLYIFDLDGTLALIDHRKHFIESGEEDWTSFYAACWDDAPNTPVIRTFQALRKAGAECWIWSGRTREVYDETIAWLSKHDILTSFDLLKRVCGFSAHESIMMRNMGDHRTDVTLKHQWMTDLEPPEWDRLVAAFDDRDSVVEMWRSNNVPCFQVAKGDF